MKCGFLFGLMVVIIATMGFGADVFVSVNGDDNAAGTALAPFKTLAKAKDVVRSMIPAATGPINVYLQAGTYYLDSAPTFTPADGGTAAVPITYSAFRGEKVIISGGIKVTSQWTASSGNTQVTTIAPNLKVDQLFLNGKRQVLARYPNYDSTKILQGYASDAISRGSRWANVTEGPGYCRGIHNTMWGGEDYIITGVSGNNAQLKWVGDNNRGDGLHAQYRMVENIQEELDAPGEWYYKKSTGQLYFYPPAGATLSSATIELATLETLIKVVGTATSKVKNITFNRLTFTHAHRTLFTGKFEGLLRGDWCVVRSGALFMQDAENITIKHCFFDQVGGNGVFMNAYNRNHRIYNNEFIGCGATCVQTVGLQSAVRTPSTWQNQINTIQDNTPGPKTEDYPKDIIIDNNLMKNLGVFEKQTAGVNISISSKVTVRHNTISYSPRSGINVNDGTWGGHTIQYNDVNNCVRETGDHGPYNSWGRDRFWGTNTTNTTTAALDAMDITRIHNNRFKDNNGLGNYGIDLDDGSSYYWVYNNLCLDCGIKFREGFCRKSYNNIMINGQQHCHVWYSSSFDSVYHNIIVNANPYEFITVTLSATKSYFDDNLFWNNGGSVNASATKNAGQDAHSQTADPKFTNTAAGDYRVAAGSPALALGFVNFPMDSFGRMNVVPDTTEPAIVSIAEARPQGSTTVRWIRRSNGIAVRYGLIDRAIVSIDLYLVNGKKVACIVNAWEGPGVHEHVVDAKTVVSLLLANTVYLVKAAVGSYYGIRSLPSIQP